MANKKLVEYIREARKRGFDDFQIRDPLVKGGWPPSDVEEAFAFLKPKTETKYKKEITIYLDSELLKRIEKRADKNMFSVPEQIEDILRRSTLNMRKKTPQEEKLDDKFITFFSRKRTK
jgi:hypothetical protein